MKRLRPPGAIVRRTRVLICTLGLVILAAGLTLIAPGEAHGGAALVTSETPDPLLRVAYAGLRRLGVVEPPRRWPEQEAAMRYIQAHQRRPIITPPAETWGGLLREVISALRGGERRASR